MAKKWNLAGQLPVETAENMKWEKRVEWILGLVILVLVALLANAGFLAPGSVEGAQEETVVVIDAGHGGADPGKVSTEGIQEKEINLEIARFLQTWLEEKGITVVMTRETDVGLYSEGTSNKKMEDLQNRCSIIDEANAVIAVSIHQNSYHDSSVNGCQVFYCSGSEEGEHLAECIQSSMIALLQPEKERTIKANDSYYLLLHTQTPTVIVECGFLSNFSEAQKLSSEEYQEQTAEAIGEGIFKYLDY